MDSALTRGSGAEGSAEISAWVAWASAARKEVGWTGPGFRETETERARERDRERESERVRAAHVPDNQTGPLLQLLRNKKPSPSLLYSRYTLYPAFAGPSARDLSVCRLQELVA